MSGPASDPRDEGMLLAWMTQSLPGYTPEWSPGAPGAAYAVMQAFARLGGIVNDRLSRAPDRNLLACLDMAGLHLLPAQAARVPLVFSVLPGAPFDVTLPAGSQAAAEPVPVPPSPEPATTQAPVPPQPVVFATETTVTLARGRLASLYSIDPGSDQFADHSAALTSADTSADSAPAGFTFFDAMQLTPHHMYLGHDQLFALGGSIALIVSFLLKRTARAPVSLAWEYYTASGWMPLPYNLEDDTTDGLTANGQVILRHTCGPNAQKKSVGGIESYWLRARLTTPLPPLSVAPAVTVNDIRVRVQFGKTDLSPDAAFADAMALDVSKDFYPFGQMPVLSSAFYLSCEEAFGRAGANVKVDFTPSSGVTVCTSGPAQLTWEFSTDSGWAALSVQPDDYHFYTKMTVLFAAPSEWAEREVNGVTKRWLRVRISGGDFGQPLRVSGFTTTTAADGTPIQQPQFAASSLAPPMVQKIAVSFTYQTDPVALDHCVAYNDFVCTDVSEAARWPDQSFVPFVPVADLTPSVHFGLESAPPDGLASLYLDAPTQEARSQSPSPFLWEYRAGDGWHELTVLDETSGFQQSGMIQFIGPRDAAVVPGLGGTRYWLRARLKQGESVAAAPVDGIWLNAVWAAQKQTIERELAGRSDGNPGQSFTLSRQPVLAGEIVEVEEWTGVGEAWRSALADVQAADIRLDQDPATGAAVAAWVRWRERPNFYDSTLRDRHYVLERATAMLRLGLNVPFAGKRIVASYSSGGGVVGNVPTAAISELRVAVPYLGGVANPIAARGGADAEAAPDVVLRGPQHLRHRDRALSVQDFEWLTLEASPEVAHVRCHAVAGPDGTAQRGWVTLVVVPRSLEAQPTLSAVLAREIFDYVTARSPAGMSLRVVGPRYVPVSVHVVAVPVDPTQASLVELRLRDALNGFLHPLTGGRDGRGWMFGQAVWLSQIASVIRRVDGVDHAEESTILVDGVLVGGSVVVPPDALAAAGPHELTLRLGAS